MISKPLEFKSKDGLLTSSSIEDVLSWDKIVTKSKLKEARWVDSLRLKGYSAAHPNDGWIDRENNKFQLVYPQFNDGVVVGSKVMLGWPDDDYNRPVRVTGIEKSKFFDITYFLFEDIEF